MLSRPKHGIIILENAQTIRKSPQAKMFNQILDLMEERKQIGDFLDLDCQNHGNAERVSSVEELRLLDGGCKLPCNYVQACGHRCTRLCHSDDPYHRATRCPAECDRLVEGCGHACRLCFEECVGSQVIAKVQLDCGHIASNLPRNTVKKHNSGILKIHENYGS